MPDVRLPEQQEYEIGVWGNHRRQYLKQHHRIKYYNMLMQCTLYPHLADVEQQTQALFLRIVEEMTRKEDPTERIKAENPLKWIGLMNNIRSAATEVVLRNLIYR